MKSVKNTSITPLKKLAAAAMVLALPVGRSGDKKRYGFTDFTDLTDFTKNAPMKKVFLVGKWYH